MLTLMPLLAVVIVAIRGTKSPPVEKAAGGTYSGLLPGFGQVQIDLFLTENFGSNGWLYTGGVSQANYLDITFTNDLFHTDVVSYHPLRTNATISFRLMDTGSVLHGTIIQSNAESQEFILLRIFEHLAVNRSSGLMFGRIGANANFYGEFPSIKTDSSFHSALNAKLATKSKAAAYRYTSGDLDRQWEMLRYGPQFEGFIQQQTQTRLLTDTVASFAVWTYPQYGGCGDPERWTAHNYRWHDGKLYEFHLADLFRPGSGWETEIRRLCSTELERQDEDGPAADVVEAELGTFTVSPTGLQIYFDPYTISSGGDGAFVIHIPYAQLNAFFKPGVFPLCQDRSELVAK